VTAREVAESCRTSSDTTDEGASVTFSLDFDQSLLGGLRP
jgi:hypothetical protein